MYNVQLIEAQGLKEKGQSDWDEPTDCPFLLSLL